MLRQIVEPVFWYGFFVGACTVVIAFVLWVFLAFQRTPRRLNKLRQQGLYPQPGDPVSESDYLKLIKAGFKPDAVRLYRQTNRVSSKKAKAAIERLVTLISRR
ncbi:MAG: hypothetical protein IPP35_02950 [Elusimicrobia bacterium]|nr:hypothetical protein [Elusimicrobiota bacterium]